MFNWSLNLSFNDLIINVISYSTLKLNPWANVLKEGSDLSKYATLFTEKFQKLSHSTAAKKKKNNQYIKIFHWQVDLVIQVDEYGLVSWILSYFPVFRFFNFEIVSADSLKSHFYCDGILFSHNFAGYLLWMRKEWILKQCGAIGTKFLLLRWRNYTARKKSQEPLPENPSM